MARSNIETKFQAVAQGICEVLWLKKLLEELRIKIKVSFKVYHDNKVAINIPLNLVQHDRTKHFVIDRHFIKERVKDEIIYITYIPTKEQTIYIFTKGLPRQSFNDFIWKWDIISIHNLM